VQCALFDAEHSPQAPDGWQAGVLPPHSPSPAQARQALAARSHTGVAPEHCALEVHGTQTPRASSQAGVAPLQRLVLVAEHCPHAPDVWQAGVAPPQSASAAQARQVRLLTSHTGVAPAQFASLRQATQLPRLVRQSGVAPVHRVVLVAEHCPQVPLG
jgi:hypothetical protein